jgi:hypothetical protein
MSDMQNYLRKKAAELGLERGDQLSAIQAHLDELYPGQCRAISLNDGLLKITTPNASMASELRMRQREFIVRWGEYGVTKIVPKIA